MNLPVSQGLQDLSILATGDDDMSNNLYENLNELIQGVIVISGLPGTGKTIAAMTIARPSEQVVLDFDLKDEPRCKSLGIPYFRPSIDNLSNATDYDLEAILAWTQTAFKAIAEEGKKGRNTLIIDNGSPLEEALGYAVGKNPTKYGVNPKNAQTGAYGGVNPGVAVLWQNTVKYFLSNGFKRIIICMHMSQSWANGVPVDKMKVKGNKALTQLSNLSVVLSKSNLPNHAPVGLIGKEALGMLRWDEPTNKYHICMALPPRMPEFGWDHVLSYMKDLETSKKTSFTKEETWSQKEVEQYSPWLSDAQRDFILTIARNPNFTLGDGDEPASGEKQPLIPTENVKVQEPSLDWTSLTQFAKLTCGMDVNSLKEFLKDKFGGFKQTDLQNYYNALKEYSGKQVGFQNVN
jgi:hypothetical protein